MIRPVSEGEDISLRCEGGVCTRPAPHAGLYDDETLQLYDAAVVREALKGLAALERPTLHLAEASGTRTACGRRPVDYSVRDGQQYTRRYRMTEDPNEVTCARCLKRKEP